MPKRTRDYHEFLLEQLTDPVFAADYLNEARQDSQKMFLKALRNVAESRRMAVVAVEAGVNRESLYKSLSEDGNPRLATYDSILSALGLDYDIKPKQVAVFGSSEPSPKTKEHQDATSVRINFETGNTLQSAGLSFSNDIRVTVTPVVPEPTTPSLFPEWTFETTPLGVSEANNSQDEQDATMATLMPPYMIDAIATENLVPQRQSAGRA